MDELTRVLNSKEEREELTNKIFRRCMALTMNKEEAQDVAQDTFLRALEKIDQFDGRNLEGWLFTIARNIFIDKTRKKKEILPGDVPEVMVDSHEEGTITQLDLEKCLKNLEEDEREIIAAIPVSSYNEIQEQLEISASNLRVKIFRARNKLAECLGLIS